MSMIRRAVPIFCAVLFVAAVVGSLRSITRVTPVIADITSLPVIVIDAGHGGIDGGAVAGDIVEKDINLAICLVLRDIFTANGFEVVMTRESDISIHDESVSGVKKQKTSDLRNRLAIVDSHPNAIFLSIHQNKYESASAKGAQIFYSPNNAQSRDLAELMQQDFVAMLQPENHRQVKKAGKNLYLMYQAKCPAVLIESGFISNAEEAAMLTDSDYQAQIAFTTFCSVMRFLGLDATSA